MPLPTTFEELRESFVFEVATDQHAVVGALVAVARHVFKGVADVPEREREALSLVERWLDGKAEETDIDAMYSRMRAEWRVEERHASPIDQGVLGIVGGIVTVATYEDHADWPEEVVEAAIDLLEHLGTSRREATREVAAILAEHGLLRG